MDKSLDESRPNYWLDACEEEGDFIPCEFIGEFNDFGGEINGIDPSFFGGIDRILDSIKNGDGVPCNGDGVVVDGASNGGDCMGVLPPKDVRIEGFDVEGGSVGALVSDRKMDGVDGNGVLSVNGEGGIEGLVEW